MEKAGSDRQSMAQLPDSGERAHPEYWLVRPDGGKGEVTAHTGVDEVRDAQRAVFSGH